MSEEKDLPKGWEIGILENVLDYMHIPVILTPYSGDTDPSDLFWFSKS